MPIYSDKHIIASIHDFKTNISKYIRMLERGDYRAVQVCRYNDVVGVFITHNSQKLFEAREKERQEALKRGDDMKVIIDNAQRKKED